MIRFFENPTTRFQRAVNHIWTILFVSVMVGCLASIYWKSIRDEQTVRVIDGGTVKSATAGSSGISGGVYRGTGAVVSGEYMTVETTKGIYIIHGHHSFTLNEAVRIEETREGQKKLCTASMCAGLK